MRHLKAVQFALLAVVVAGVIAATPADAAPETYTVTCLTVTYGSDEKPSCTTWDMALTRANEHAGHDVIKFAIPGPGPHRIHLVGPQSALVTDRVTIDGYSAQFGARMNTLASGSNANVVIHFVGRGPNDSTMNFTLRTDGSEVHGVAFENFYRGLSIDGDRNLIRGNFFGSAASPQAGRNAFGIEVEGHGNRIGGAEPKDRNIISGNDTGVFIIGAGDGVLQANVVENNLIGTAPDGVTPVANVFGVDILGASGNNIGGPGSGHGNVISGNTTGVWVRRLNAGGLTLGNRIANNLIGTDATGTRAVPNGTGVYTAPGVTGTTIGGTTFSSGNVISGNGGGLLIEGAGHVIQGNLVGVGYGDSRLPNNEGIVLRDSLNVKIGGATSTPGDAPGNVIVGNANSGIHVTDGRNTEIQGNAIQGNGVGVGVLGGLNHLVGGTTAAAANKIWSNRIAGVRVTGGASGVRVLRNSISNTSAPSIDLGTDGPTANDVGDGDSGPNGLQNFPVLTEAVPTSAGLQVRGTLNSLPNRDFVVQVYGQTVSSGPGEAGRCSGTHDRGQGRNFLGEINARTGPDGNAAFSGVVGRAPGQSISATATSNETSEFSDCISQRASADLQVSKTAPPGATAGSNFTYTVDVRNLGPSPANAVVMEDELQPTTTFVSMTPPRDWTCTHPAPGSGGNIRCERTLPLDPAHGWQQFTIVGRVPADTPDGAEFIPTAATVSSADHDPNPSNNRSSATFTSRRGANLALAKTASSPTVAAGGALSYGLRITNAGPSDAAGVGFADPLPADTTFVSLSQPAGWTCTVPPPGYSGGTVKCDIGELRAGAPAQDFTIVVNVAAEATGTLVNKATVLAATTDPDENNNSSSVRTPIGEGSPPGYGGAEGTIEVEEESEPPPNVRSMVVDPASFAFGDCTRADGSPARGMTFPNGRCTSPAITVTNTGAASNVYVAGSEARPTDAGPSWVLCYAASCVQGPDLPGDDQYSARLFSADGSRQQFLDETPRCDTVFGSGQDGDGCFAASGEAQVERVEIVGPRSSSSAARRLSTTLIWVAAP